MEFARLSDWCFILFSKLPPFSFPGFHRHAGCDCAPGWTESGVGSCLETARANSPDDQTENLAPYASSSSRDPMAAMAGTSPDEESYSELFMGPPQDDDGHELHDVGIV
eukprot:scaffold1361_cov165-Amphora_coffeaeformis.AAC.15